MDTGVVATSTFSARYALATSVVLGGLVAWLAGLLYTRLSSPRRNRVFAGADGGGPKVFKSRFVTNARDIVREGIRKVGESNAFWVRALIGPTVVLPRKYLPEIKNSKDLGFADYLKDAFAADQTRIGHQIANPIFLTVVRKNVTQTLNHTTGVLSEETALALEDKFPRTEEWTAHAFQPQMLDVVARVSARVFLGLPLCRDRDWLAIVHSHAMSSAGAAMILRCVPTVLRPVVAPLLPMLRTSRKAFADARRLITGVVQQRRAAMAAQGSAYEKPNDALQWAMDMGETDATALADFQLSLASVAVHTTSSALSQMLFDLCERPEIVRALREEISSVIGDGAFEAKSEVQQLKLMDSFMKESQRMNPLQIMTLQRKVLNDITFADGFSLLRNEYVAVASEVVLRDPRLYENPDTFDAWRFYNLRQQTANETAYQYVTTTDTFFAFGYGLHACPGRFFAATEIKIILVHLLQMYDFRFPDGQTTRPPNQCFEEHNGPDPTQQILFRKRA